jgi:hypothetical protein
MSAGSRQGHTRFTLDQIDPNTVFEVEARHLRPVYGHAPAKGVSLAPMVRAYGDPEMADWIESAQREATRTGVPVDIRRFQRKPVRHWKANWDGTLSLADSEPVAKDV